MRPASTSRPASLLTNTEIFRPMPVAKLLRVFLLATIRWVSEFLYIKILNIGFRGLQGGPPGTGVQSTTAVLGRGLNTRSTCLADCAPPRARYRVDDRPEAR